MEEGSGAEPHLQPGGADIPEEGAEEEAEVEDEMMEEGADEPEASGHLPAPIAPTAKMVEEHNVSHLPFRSWCSACVRGRAKALPHGRVPDKEDEQIPTMSVDYGFFGAPGELPGGSVGGAELPVLIVTDRRSKSIWSHPVPSKGIAHPWAATALLQDLEKTGYKRIVLKSDQEPSIKALTKSFKDGWRGEAILEHSPKRRKQIQWRSRESCSVRTRTGADAKRAPGAENW